MTASATLRSELGAIVGSDNVAGADDPRLLQDATEVRRLPARADAWVRPGTAAEVAEVMAWCYEHDVPLTPRGGGTGLAGGAVPLAGGIVLALDRLTRVRSFDPLLWRMHVEAGLPTIHVRRLARENGLYFPPDPGALERSQIGGNVATNAGGPHAFKYGVTGRWLTGMEVVLAPGRVVTLGGPTRKDVSGLDIAALMIGSEGTLGVVSAVWLRLIPHPEVALPLVAAYPDAEAGVNAIESVLASGIVPAVIEYLDAGAVAASRPTFPAPLPPETGFVVLVECDGSAEAARQELDQLRDVLGEGAVALHSPTDHVAVADLWRWRAAVPLAVTAVRGGKVSEDIAVPLDRLREACERIVEIGERVGLPACSWGHAGDGNLHATFLVDRGEEAGSPRVREAEEALFEMALELGGSLSGEHGIGSLKRDYLLGHLDPQVLELQRAIKRALDPKGLLNPGKKL